MESAPASRNQNARWQGTYKVVMCYDSGEDHRKPPTRQKKGTEPNRTSAEGHEWESCAVSWLLPAPDAGCRGQRQASQLAVQGAAGGHGASAASPRKAQPLPHSLWDFINLPGSFNCQSRKNKRPGFKDSLAIWTLGTHFVLD